MAFIPRVFVTRLPSRLPSRAFSTAALTHPLPSGRVLAYHTSGPESGTPILFVHGTPDSGVSIANSHDHTVATRLGVRWLGIDRPGIGLSSPHPNRTPRLWADDVRHLLDALRIDRARIVSVSGGTPHALACALEMPDRVQGLAIVVGVAPWQAGRQGQSTANRIAMNLWKHTPSLLKMLNSATVVRAAQDTDETKLHRYFEYMVKTAHPRDAKVLSDPVIFEAMVKAFQTVYRQGADGHMQDMGIVTGDWGFRMEDVRYEGIKLWYGSEDINTPVLMGTWMEERLPGARMRVMEEESHFTLWTHIEDILKTFIKETEDS